MLCATRVQRIPGNGATIGHERRPNEKADPVLPGPAFISANFPEPQELVGAIQWKFESQNVLVPLECTAFVASKSMPATQPGRARRDPTLGLRHHHRRQGHEET